MLARAAPGLTSRLRIAPTPSENTCWGEGPCVRNHNRSAILSFPHPDASTSQLSTFNFRLSTSFPPNVHSHQNLHFAPGRATLPYELNTRTSQALHRHNHRQTNRDSPPPPSEPKS
jgi:hypothetical protein